NQESLEFFKFKYSQFLSNNNFNYLESKQKIITDKLTTVKSKKIYFIHFVESQDNNQTSNITILNEIVYLPEKYNHQFVFVEWDIEKEQLLIYSEFEKQITLIQQTKFKINL
ncbi:MAG: hypothetical protein ABH888_02835, partial [Patescibacteria group bacterium]